MVQRDVQCSWTTAWTCPLATPALWNYTACGKQQERHIKSQPARAADNHCPATAETRQGGAQPGLDRGRLQGPMAIQSRAQRRTGSYKRVEVFLGVEAAIALRQLMRSRSAREVVEALLLAEKQRMKEHPLGVKYQEVVF